MNTFTTIKEFLTKEECDLLLQFSLTKKLSDATVVNGDLDIRKSNIFFHDYSLKS